MPSTTPAAVAPHDLLNAIGEIDLACVSATPAELELENLRRRGIDVVRIKWKAPQKPKRWFGFLALGRNKPSGAGYELSFVDGQLRYHAPDARNAEGRETQIAMADIGAVRITPADARRLARMQIAYAEKTLEIGDGLSDVALVWLRDRIVLEISGLIWKPLFNIGKRSTRLTANPDDEPYRRWTSSQGRLIAIYLDQSAPKIAALKSALDAKTAAAARGAAHWLKSSSAAVGAMQLSELCQRMEIDLDAKDMLRATALAPHLFAEFEKVTAAFKSALDGAADLGDRPRMDADGADAPNPQGSLFGVSVLLVDDSKVNQEIARDCLLRGGCSVTLADGGEAAIEAHKGEAFDVILMDCQMTGIDGLATTRALRNEEMRMGRTSAPIIALTANALRDDRHLCLSAGMNDYLSKPFVEDDLMEIVSRWAKRSERQADDHAAVDVAAQDDVAAA